MKDEKTIDESINIIEKIKKEFEKTILGQKDACNLLICTILSEENSLLEGVPGLGKTMMVKVLAKILGLSFKRIQFTPDLMPADITGTNIITETTKGIRSFSFNKGPIFSNMILADEINRGTPKTQSAMLEAMQEKTVTFGNETHPLDSPFFVLATENPIEMEGTYILPEAQLDRFIFKIKINFPSKDTLKKLAEYNPVTTLSNVQQITNSTNIHFKQWKLEFLEKFSIGLSNAINIIDPDIVVIGGGLSNIQFLYDEGKKAVHKKIVGHNTDTQIVPNQLGDSSGVIGAALLN